MFLEVDRVGYFQGGPIGIKSKKDFYKIPVYGRNWLFTRLACSVSCSTLKENICDGKSVQQDTVKNTTILRVQFWVVIHLNPLFCSLDKLQLLLNNSVSSYAVRLHTSVLLQY